MNVRLLESTDAAAYQSLRLAGLQECPSAFASSFSEEAPLSLETVGHRLAPSLNGGVLGVFLEAGLVGIVGVHRESLVKLAHRANIWGMYVAPSARQNGVGRRLLTEALAFARGNLHVRQVNLGVNAKNIAATRLYEQLGFRQFGLERAFMLLDGEVHDEIHMACQLHGET